MDVQASNMSALFGGYAPIIAFAYKRPDHLRRMIESLRANSLAARSALVIACDGPKFPGEVERCEAVRAYAKTVGGFADVEVWSLTQNRGLAASVVSGVSTMLERHGRVVVVEDDLVVSPHFLRYMNDALTLYADEPRVASIHGYCYPTGIDLPETFFLRGSDCWGWATWSRAWAHFNPDGTALLRALRERDLLRRFDLDGAYPFSRMLEEQIAGHNDSWAVRWHASCFIEDALTLYPGKSLVHNIGHDGSGTHSQADTAFDQVVSTSPVRVSRLEIAESDVARAAVVRYFRAQPKSWQQRLASVVDAGVRFVRWR
jgi:hypothetical protein